jgi:NAD(P)-dependent dehydrogenase (short-subunit alcohol dehydrogenase family)
VSCYKGRVAVITGAGSGIGRELAKQLGARGARLALSDIHEEGLAETRRAICDGAEVRTYPLDVSRRVDVFAHAETVRRQFGVPHYVFNNAGATLVATIEHATIEEFEWVLGSNLWGVIYGTKAFLPMMVAQNDGCIVNVSSIFSFLTVPTQGPYHTAKFAVRGFTECLARELEGTGVRAVCVHPGGIRTNFGTSARFGVRAGEVERDMMNRVSRLFRTSAEDCARDILAGIAAGRRRLVVGRRARHADWLARVLPVRYGRVLRALYGA